MIELKKIKYTYDESFRLLLDFKINKGFFNFLIGKSGSGKSTLLNLISGYLKPNSGDIFLEGKCVNSIAPEERNISILFQENNVFNHLTVFRNLFLSSNHIKNNNTKKTLIYNILKSLEINELIDKQASKLSQGQLQRVGLAMRLLQNNPILLLDEPFSNLNKELKVRMINLLHGFWKTKNLTVILATHDTHLIKEWGNIISMESIKTNS